MNVYERIERFRPQCEQEERDRQQMLSFIEGNPDYLSRDNLMAHVTVSAWTVNQARTKTLFVYHNIYDSWSWVGGHADGDGNLPSVALRELYEETGVTGAELACEKPLSLETLTVSGHIRRGSYVPSHLHLNLTYLIVADESASLRPELSENSSVAWFAFDEALRASSEPWMVEHVYRKLVARSRSWA